MDRTQSSYRRARNAVVAATFGLLLLGCDPATAPEEPPAEAAEPGPVEDAPDAAVLQAPPFEATFEDDPECFDVDVRGPGEDTLTCGRVAVPLHHDQPDGDTVSLPVVVIPGSDPDTYPTPLVVLGGGPGEHLVGPLLSEPLVRELFDVGPDLIVLDQRGAGLSEPALECPDDGGATDGFTPADVGAALDAVTDCATTLRDAGIDLDAFHHHANAQDVGLVAQALGHDQVDLRGTSYGSQVALLTAELWPELVRTVVLSSPVDPTANWIETAGSGIQRALDLVAEACIVDEACAAEVGNLDAAIETTLERLSSEPEDVTVQPPGGQETTNRYDPTSFLGALSLLYYLPDGIALLPAFVSAAEDGDLTPLATLAALVDQQLDESISTGMHLAMLCSGEAATADVERIREALGDGIVAEHWFPYALLGGEPMPETCERWGVATAATPADTGLTSAAPTLIVTGGFDHVTPPALGRQVDEQLRTSYLVEVGPAGHAPLEALGPCGQQLVGDFLADPDERPEDTCVEQVGLRFQTGVPPGLG